MYLLDKFFFVFHTLIIFFVLLGWIWKRTRKLNLLVSSLTFLSWSVFGIWYGFGFCPCTEWHWQVRMKLGLYDLPTSYVKFLIDSVFGLKVNARLVDISTLILFLTAFIISILINIKDFKQIKRKS